MTTPELSIVVPAYDERENLALLAAEVRATVIEGGIRAELILVDDGSTDGTGEEILRLARENAWIRGLSLPHRAGQSAALLAGIRAARGEFIATLDADLQNDPADLPGLLAILRAGEADLVQGRRVPRRDPAMRRGVSAVGRVARRILLGSRLKDTGCATRILTARVAAEIPLEFNGMHRLLPVYAEMLGARVREVPVGHRPRKYGVAKYGLLDRAPGVMDCLAMRWMLRRYRAPSSHPLGPSGRS